MVDSLSLPYHIFHGLDSNERLIRALLSHTLCYFVCLRKVYFLSFDKLVRSRYLSDEMIEAVENVETMPVQFIKICADHLIPTSNNPNVIMNLVSSLYCIHIDEVSSPFFFQIFPLTEVQ